MRLFRNDFVQNGTRTPYGTAVYVKDDPQLILQSLRSNYNYVEMMLLKANQPVNNLHIVGICSPSKVKIIKFIDALRGPSTLTWELWTGDRKTTLEDKKKLET